MEWGDSVPLASPTLLCCVAGLALCGGAAALLSASSPKMAGYQDDTFAALGAARRVVALNGAQGLTGMKFAPPAGAGGAALDARHATFTIANSRNPAPTAASDCNQGTEPVNRYPLVVEQQDGTAVVGGLFLSRVPQAWEWRATYCNSAAITFQEAPNGIVDGVRITGAWDAIRAGRGSPNLTVANSWISNVRDDSVEDDFLQPATIRDVLIDGAFQGISVKPRKDSPTEDASDRSIILSGVLLRLREYAYKDGRRFGALLKSDSRAPRAQVTNSIVAVAYEGGDTYPQFWTTSWAKLSLSSNNLFLWLSDAPIPATMPLPPASFRVLRGQAARDAWARAERNWIDCHPKLARLATDPRSAPGACVADTWGGFTR
jgi:hypothetical protein